MPHAAFSPDGLRVVTVGSDQTITWWSMGNDGDCPPQQTIWSSGMRWVPNPKFADKPGNTIWVLDSRTGNIALLRSLTLDEDGSNSGFHDHRAGPRIDGETVLHRKLGAEIAVRC